MLQLTLHRDPGFRFRDLCLTGVLPTVFDCGVMDDQNGPCSLLVQVIFLAFSDCFAILVPPDAHIRFRQFTAHADVLPRCGCFILQLFCNLSRFF